MYKGVRYFKSSAGRGKFVKLLELEPDKRFIDSPTPQHVFKVGNKVEVGRSTKEYGVISWVGNVDGSGEDYVKVITVSYNLQLTMYISYVLYLWCLAYIPSYVTGFEKTRFPRTQQQGILFSIT